SQIDGDGWNNVSEIPSYNKTGTLSAEVIRKEILEPYRDFAFDVGLITAETDINCYGVQNSESVARAIFALPNVEPSSHTHSHPVFWRFFSHYTLEKENPFLKLYPPRPIPTASMLGTIKAKLEGGFGEGTGAPAKPADGNTPEQLGKNDETEDVI